MCLNALDYHTALYSCINHSTHTHLSEMITEPKSVVKQETLKAIKPRQPARVKPTYGCQINMKHIRTVGQ